MDKANNSAWGRITVPLSGAEHEVKALNSAALMAQSFGAQLNVIFAAPDPAQLAPWLGEGFMGTVQMSTMDEIKSVSEDAQKVAQQQYNQLQLGNGIFHALQSPMWQELAIQVRLSDLVVFDDVSAKGKGLLAEAFQQVLMEERCGVFIVRNEIKLNGTALVAWDGKEPSSRAARRATPLLKLASKVIIIGSPVGDFPVDLQHLADYYKTHGIEAEVEAFAKGDILMLLNEACVRHEADYLVAGAFGHSRLREFAFGGTTRALLQSSSVNLYMAH